MSKEFKCPYCGSMNVIQENSQEEKFSEKLPENLGKAILIGTASLLTGGLGGVALGAVLYGKSVVKYLDGTKITCGNCYKDFKVIIN